MPRTACAVHLITICAAAAAAAAPNIGALFQVLARVVDQAVPRQPCVLRLELPPQMQHSSSSEEDDFSDSDSSDDETGSSGSESDDGSSSAEGSSGEDASDAE